MKIYDYWAKSGLSATAPNGQKYWLVAWGGSNSDVNDAEINAHKSVEAMQRKLRHTETLEADRM